MRKHRLHLNALQVESFVIPQDSGQGTVRGHERQPDNQVFETPPCTRTACGCPTVPSIEPTICGHTYFK
jgi:hypothetical protein